MSNLPHSTSPHDAILLRAARMTIKHHRAIAPVRAPALTPSVTGRIIVTRFVRDIAPDVAG